MAVNWSLAAPQFNPLEVLQAAGQASQQAWVARQLQQREQQFQQEQQQRAGRVAAQAQLASGDVAGARKAALANGDFDFASAIGKLSAEDQKRAGEQADIMGQVAAGLRQLPMEQRQSALRQYAPALMQRGFSLQEIQGASQDLSDGTLDGFINTSRSINDTLSAGRVKYMAIPEGGYLQGFDAMTGAPIGASTPPPQQAAPQASGGDDLERMAQEAIAQGADPAAVRARLQSMRGGAGPQAQRNFP